MGSIQVNEHLLCLLPFPEPKPMTDLIRKENPHLKVTYYQLDLKMDWNKDEGFPEDLWQDVTVLYTLSQFPVSVSQAPNLKMIHLFSTGTDHIWNLPIYKDTNIPITTCAGVPAPVIAEWTLMNILVASHKYNTLRSWQLDHAWDDVGGGKALFMGVSSAVGKKFGILGYGAVGRQVANVAKSLGMDVIACTASPRDTLGSKRYLGYSIPNTGDEEGRIPSQWFNAADKSSLHEFLAQDIDYLLISLPLTSKTKNLLGEEEFKILSRRNTFVINISRGEVIDQERMIEALHEYENDTTGVPGKNRKGISGAALDVATPEPLPKDHPLWEAPNVIISPHICGISKEYGAHAFQILRTNLDRLAGGRRLLNQIERETGYASVVPKI